jgi:hypothetical protein
MNGFTMGRPEAGPFFIRKTNFIGKCFRDCAAAENMNNGRMNPFSEPE